MEILHYKKYQKNTRTKQSISKINFKITI